MIPHNVDAERAVLGGILVDNSQLPAAQELLSESDFYRQGHRLVWRAMLSLHESASAIDLLTLTAALDAMGELDSVGALEGAGPHGAAYLAILVDGVPKSTNVRFYAQIVASKARRRALIGPTEALLAAALNGEPDEEVESALARLIEMAPLSDAGGGYALEPLRFSDYDEDEPLPIAFGSEGGEAPIALGDLIVFAGDSGAGKSLSLLDLSIAWCTGAAWLGFPSKTAGGRVLIVTSDGDGAAAVRARVVRLGQGRGLSVADLDALPLRVVVSDTFNLDTSASFASLQKLIAEFDPDLLGLETLSTLMGPERDVNKAADVTGFISRRLRPLQPRPGGTRRTEIIGAHLRKKAAVPGANALRDRVAGSFRVVAGADSVIGFEPAGDRAFNVKLVKLSRWGLRFRPFHVSIEGDPPHPLSLKTTGPIDETPSERMADERRFLDALSALAGLGPNGWAKLAEVKRRAGVDPKDGNAVKRFERTAKRLVENGSIEAHEKRRACYRLTAKGSGLPLEDESE